MRSTASSNVATSHQRAHDYANFKKKNFNTVSQQTLAARVCAEDSGLEMSGEQMSACSSLRGNLGAEGDGTPIGTMGPLMCTLSLLVWTITNVRTR
jgi:hypothetical protein